MYIRTKDNAIYEIVNGNVIIGNMEVQIDIRKAIKEGNIVADTIWKLCDEFVIDDKKHKVHFLMDYDDVIEELYDGRIYEHDFVYGAIWTDKGLIYVAKMDEKGELELIWQKNN